MKNRGEDSGQKKSKKGNEGDRMVIIRRPEWGLLVFTSRLIYIRKLALKQSLDYVKVMNPSTTILRISQLLVHVINEEQ
jgi:hypothetical protein